MKKERLSAKGKVWCGEILEKQLEEKDDENREWKTERFKVVTKNYVCSIFGKTRGRLTMKEMCDSKKWSQFEDKFWTIGAFCERRRCRLTLSVTVWRQEDKNIAFFEFSGLSSSHISRHFEQKSKIIECWAIKKRQEFSALSLLCSLCVVWHLYKFIPLIISRLSLISLSLPSSWSCRTSHL